LPVLGKVVPFEMVDCVGVEDGRNEEQVGHHVHAKHTIMETKKS